MLEAIFGNATAEKVLLYIESRGEGYAQAIADTFDDVTLRMAQVQLARFERRGRPAQSAQGPHAPVHLESALPVPARAENAPAQGIRLASRSGPEEVLPATAAAAKNRQAVVSVVTPDLDREQLAAAGARLPQGAQASLDPPGHRVLGRVPAGPSRSVTR